VQHDVAARFPKNTLQPRLQACNAAQQWLHCSAPSKHGNGAATHVFEIKHIHGKLGKN
jgi:hypothetical protein